MTDRMQEYSQRLIRVLADTPWEVVNSLVVDLEKVWLEKRQLFICGNGGSAGNAIHLANDFVYGIAKCTGGGLRATALSANPAVLTCLANDLDYESIYSEQLALLGNAEDLLLILSGSGNSGNVL